MIEEKDLIFKTLLSCQRNRKNPDLHSFTISIKGGVAFVKADEDGEILIQANIGDKRKEYKGVAVAMANLLSNLGADQTTISM